MRSALLRVIDPINDTYPNPEQRQAILDYSASMPDRLAATSAIHEAEDAVADAALKALRDADPFFDKNHPDAWEDGIDELIMTLRVCVQAMLLDSQDYLEEKGLRLLRGSLKNASARPQVPARAYAAARDALMNRLDPAHGALIAPYLERTLSSLPRAPQS